MAAGVNVPVLVGVVPLYYVQSINISEGYRIERIYDSKFLQATAPTKKTISIEAMLIGEERLVQKKKLEALGLASQLMAISAAPLLGIIGIPVVSGLTISLDMRITDLRFSQSVQKRDALDVSITLEHVPRSGIKNVLSEAADLALAAGLLTVPTIQAAANTIPRLPRKALSSLPGV